MNPEADDHTEMRFPLVLLMETALGGREVAVNAALTVCEMRLEGVIEGLPAMTSEEGFAATVVWANHRVRMMEIRAPYPKAELATVIQTTRAPNDSMAGLYGHSAHIMCWYLGNEADPIGQAQAMFQLCAALGSLGILGVIQLEAQQCFMPQAFGHLGDLANKDEVYGAAGMLLCNLIPFHGPKGTWWTTKGNHAFGIPDFALWDSGGIGHKPAQSLLASMFDYVRDGAQLRIGDSGEFAGLALRFSEVTEYKEHLCGPGETLALIPIGGASARSAIGNQVDAPAGCIPVSALVIMGTLFLVLIFFVPDFNPTPKKVLGALGIGCFVLIPVQRWLR
jgi:hypothetical protein